MSKASETDSTRKGLVSTDRRSPPGSRGAQAPCPTGRTTMSPGSLGHRSIQPCPIERSCRSPVDPPAHVLKEPAPKRLSIVVRPPGRNRVQGFPQSRRLGARPEHSNSQGVMKSAVFVALVSRDHCTDHAINAIGRATVCSVEARFLPRSSDLICRPRHKSPCTAR